MHTLHKLGFYQSAVNAAQLSKAIEGVFTRVPQSRVLDLRYGNKAPFFRALKIRPTAFAVPTSTAQRFSRLKSFENRIVTPKGLNAINTFQDAGIHMPKKISGKSKELLNKVVLNHEANEIRSKAMSDSYLNRWGHVSPKVILREHNIVSQLSGEGSKPVRDIMHTLRKGKEGAEIHKAIPNLGYQHGKSERLSRHAIRRITDIVNRV